MRPRIPPIVLASVLRLTGHPIKDQAKAAGFDYRHFRKLLLLPWEDWRIGRAEEWCRSFGLDFWNLEPPACRFRWDARRDRKALLALLGGKATHIPALVRKLNTDLMNGQVGT